MKRTSSPLRYPGSKIKLVKYLSKIIEFNNFCPEVIVEPFVGGGSVFLNFLSHDWAKSAIIGDKDPLIYSFWKTVFTDPQHLIRFINKVDVNVDTFAYYKKIASQDKKHSTKKLAEACLFLNRTSFSGVMADTAGPIGGTQQKSTYTIDCRFNREALCKKINTISQLSDRVTVVPYSWSRTIDYVAKKGFKAKKVLFYLDPPFYYKADKLYRHYFRQDAEHVRLSNKLKSLRSRWILSYDRAPEVKELYHSFINGSFAFPYSINSPAKRIQREYLITSRDLVRPNKSYLTR